jgi:signal transduction histidine kinase
MVGMALPTLRPHAAAGHDGGSLTKLFAVAGALAIGLFSLAMGLLLSRFIETRMLERDAAVSRDFVQSIAKTQDLAAVLAAGPGRRAAQHPQFAEFVDHLGAMPGVLRVNVYAPDRFVLWSTRSELIGRRFDANDELDEALAGATIVHAAAAPDKAEHLLLGAGPGRYVENYLPVTDDGGGAVIAVVELYRRPDALFDAIHSGQRLMATGAAAGGLLLFAALVGFVVRVERRLREQRRRLVDAEAMAIVGEISAAVAHSIRNPLGSIRSAAELRREIDGDAHGAWTDVMRHVDRIERLVRSMLAYAVPPAGGARTELGAVVAEVAAASAPELQRQGRRLELDLEPRLGSVEADALLLAQIVQTLLSNAAEATQPGGRIRLHSRRDGAAALLEVSDDGVGIEPERLPQVTKPFHTSKPGGLGMGLALAQRVAQRLGGSLDIDSAPGAGTRVRLHLPVAPG